MWVEERAAKVGVSGKQDAVEIERLALEPVGAGEQPHEARNRVRLVGPDAHTDAVVQPRAQQMIDDVEALLAVGIVGAANIDRTAEAAERIVAEESDHLDQVVARDLDGQLAERDLGLEQLRAEAVREIASKLIESFVHHGSRTGSDRSALDGAGPPDLLL